jgi:asparagine synthase (glutamine-hydrolysing)
MCGICGFAGDYRPEMLQRMQDLIIHRGPDGEGAYWDREMRVGIGMRRLAILDISGGKQPMSNEDGSMWIVYNGEIYNSPELRPRLEASGHNFQSDHSDTEVLLHLYEELGIEALNRLNGMFAFAIFDKRRRKIIAARDRIGIKPFYYWQDSGFFAFASELKCLFEIPEVSRAINVQALFHYLSLLYVPGENSIMQGVKRLLPGHWLEYDLENKATNVGQFWDIEFSHQEDRPTEEWCELIRETLKRSIKRRLLSDVPVGCSLSGGIDSSGIVGLLGSMNSSQIKTYSLGFRGSGEEEWDELPLARLVAERWDTQHHEMVLKPERLLDDLISMVWHLDEPYAGGLPSWYVFKYMREDVVVGLSGTGGDELFGNYGKYLAFEKSRLARLALAYRESPEAFRRYFWSPGLWLASKLPATWIGSMRKEQLKSLPVLAEQPMRWFYMGVWYYFDDDTKRKRIFASSNDGVDTGQILQELHNESGASDIRNAIAYVDFKTQLADEFLFFTDRLSMAHSLEARVPYLDHEFVELAMRIPSQIRSKQTDWKHLLKKAIGPLIPSEILNARKRGFVIPIKLWLRSELKPLADRLLSPERLKAQGIFHPGFYENFVAPHQRGQDYTWQIWAMLMFQLWHVVFVETGASTRPSFDWRDLV